MAKMHVEPWVDRLLEQFGKNPYGRKIYRIVWSEDVFVWEYGQELKRYGEGKNRWILEKWLPPEMYDKETWESQVLRDDNDLIIISPKGEIQYVLGPFPKEGAYEHCYTFEGANGEYCPIEIGLLELLCRCIEAGKMMTPGERYAAIKAKQEKKDAEDAALFNDIWKDAAPAAGAKLPDHCERFGSFDVQRRMAEASKRLPQGFGQVSEDTIKKITN